MHCTARSNIAHLFVDKLQEGRVYFIGNFKVRPNKDEYRIVKDNDYMIELEGSTYVTKATADVDGFLRYPFQFVEFENLQPMNKIYVIGKNLCSCFHETFMFNL